MMLMLQVPIVPSIAEIEQLMLGRRKRMKAIQWKEHLGVILCCCLSAGIIIGSITWLEQNSPKLTADDALAQAEQSAYQYCARQGVSQCDLKLVDSNAPETLLARQPVNTMNGRWEFEFYSSKLGKLQVQVPENGQKIWVSKLAG